MSNIKGGADERTATATIAAHIQPTNDELRAALADARAEVNGPPSTDASVQRLWTLRDKRTTWFDTNDLALRAAIDSFFCDLLIERGSQ